MECFGDQLKLGVPPELISARCHSFFEGGHLMAVSFSRHRRENEGLLGADVFQLHYHNAPKNPYCTCSIHLGTWMPIPPPPRCGGGRGVLTGKPTRQKCRHMSCEFTLVAQRSSGRPRHVYSEGSLLFHSENVLAYGIRSLSALGL